jgi:hypothetical protein
VVRDTPEVLGDADIAWAATRIHRQTGAVYSPGRPCLAAAPLLPRSTEQDRPPVGVEAADLFEPVLVRGGQIGFGEPAHPFGEVLGTEGRVAADGEF